MKQLAKIGLAFIFLAISAINCSPASEFHIQVANADLKPKLDNEDAGLDVVS